MIIRIGNSYNHRHYSHDHQNLIAPVQGCDSVGSDLFSLCGSRFIRVGDAVPQQLVCWSQGREVWVRDLTESMLCSCSRHFTLTVPLSTQLKYTWVPGREGRGG